ncbi:hypothetical protein SAMD00079811_73770 [Scytonema sp. HK-05]|uniref:hypothetical protein n=1 Tax=Scytonema sp. HK-05 TaxID=1137095 RepID=UPI0009361B04|nr:hypothetical protein [Scytonema sp. HK-05]OKH43756.1 hypothetical protein NIES2130_38465 [Scytonema sp. HK-05]BAY49748.1 hypothetical protein SAMD00079811_73770 [Scytonema sp. HK-05]
MNPIVEINEDGVLHLPSKILEAIKPNTRFVVEVNNGRLILHPQSNPQPFWVTATSEERAEGLMQWVLSHKEGPNLPDEALRRENIYE